MSPVPVATFNLPVSSGGTSRLTPEGRSLDTGRCDTHTEENPKRPKVKDAPVRLLPYAYTYRSKSGEHGE